MRQSRPLRRRSQRSDRVHQARLTVEAMEDRLLLSTILVTLTTDTNYHRYAAQCDQPGQRIAREHDRLPDPEFGGADDCADLGVTADHSADDDRRHVAAGLRRIAADRAQRHRRGGRVRWVGRHGEQRDHQGPGDQPLQRRRNQAPGRRQAGEHQQQHHRVQLHRDRPDGSDRRGQRRRRCARHLQQQHQPDRRQRHFREHGERRLPERTERRPSPVGQPEPGNHRRRHLRQHDRHQRHGDGGAGQRSFRRQHLRRAADPDRRSVGRRIGTSSRPTRRAGSSSVTAPAARSRATTSAPT